MLVIIFLVLAIISFVSAAINIGPPKVNMGWVGWALVISALLASTYMPFGR